MSNLVSAGASRSESTTPLEEVLKRDRAMVIAGVVAVAAIAWGSTIYVDQSNADIGNVPGGLTKLDPRN